MYLWGLTVLFLYLSEHGVTPGILSAQLHTGYIQTGHFLTLSRVILCAQRTGHNSETPGARSKATKEDH